MSVSLNFVPYMPPLLVLAQAQSISNFHLNWMSSYCKAEPFIPHTDPGQGNQVKYMNIY